MTLDPDPSLLLRKAPVPLRYEMPRLTPPLDLNVVPFRYRVDGEGIRVIRSRCRHERKERR